MSGRLLFYLLYFGLGSFVISGGLANMALNRVRIVLLRGEGSNPLRRWRSGTKRMLNGEKQLWYVLFYSTLSVCFLFFTITSGYRFVTGEPAGELRVFGLMLFLLFTSAMIVIPLTALQDRRATQAIQALDDPMEMDKQIKTLRHYIARADSEAAEKLQPVLDLMGRIRGVMDGQQG